MSSFKNLYKIIKNYLSEEHIKQLKKAYIFARDAHKGQTRSSGDPYITHPVAVACILAEMKLDHKTLMATLLHDVIEDTSLTYKDMEKSFGKDITKLVEGVSKLDQLNFRNKKEAQIENLCKMIMAMVQDIRVILIKLADRMHNMRTINFLHPDKRRRIAQETLEIYSPLAYKLGINYLKIELEELGFKSLNPNQYYLIKDIVKTSRINRNTIIKKIFFEINYQLERSGIDFRITVEEKHLFSIYQKMHLKEQKFYSIMDNYAFRIIVQDLNSCYKVLGQIHNLYKPRHGCIKDYIAIPKANGYQSLHTSMVGPHGLPLEIQIRTEYMDHMAEMGVTAYWLNKQFGKNKTITQISAQRWLKKILELKKSACNQIDFIENLKLDLVLNEIYVFTDKRLIVELPTGATPVDFAYAIHSDIGHGCI